MFEIGTTEHWWPIAKKYPSLSNTKQILKPLGYAHMINLIETFKFEKILEVGHGSGSYLFDIFNGKAELWGLDDTIEDNRVPSESLKEMIQDNPHVKFVKGLLGQNLKELPDNYFDFVCSVSVLEHIPEESIYEVFKDIFRILKPGGIFSHSFDISFKKDTKYVFDNIENLGFEWLKQKDKMNVFWEDWMGDFDKKKIEGILRNIVFENPSIVAETFMWETERSQRKSPTNFVSILMAARKPYNKQNEPNLENHKISVPTVKNFDEYTYSKKQHFQLFKENEDDVILLNNKIDIVNCDIKDYQNLLCYSFIKNNIKRGSKILKIGSIRNNVIEKIKNEYDCSVVLNNENVSYMANTEDFKIIDGLIGSFSEEMPDNYYDFIFSTSLAESKNSNSFELILQDINRLVKPGGYVLMCNVFMIKEPEMRLSPFSEYILQNQKMINRRVNSLKISLDNDLYTLNENFYKQVWEPVIGKSIEDFGLPYSYNFLWKSL